jgi:hypothetical protein
MDTFVIRANRQVTVRGMHGKNGGGQGDFTLDAAVPFGKDDQRRFRSTNGKLVIRTNHGGGGGGWLIILCWQE